MSSRVLSCRPLIALVVVLVVGAGPLGAVEPTPLRQADAAVLQAASTLFDGVRTETLPNGLRVYLKPVPTSPVVTTMVAYKVGSADENLDHTGLSHYLEHLMFKGTARLMPGDIDRLTQRNGGANNAYTSHDYTIFHFDFAAENWEVALGVEADRMRNLRIDEVHEFDKEKGAVVSELEKDEDEPWDLEQKAILPLLFGKAAPYGHPVIGEREHVYQATAEVIKAHYDRWYHPNNAALIVVGGFDPDRALARIKELFGPIPRAQLPQRRTAAELRRKGVTRAELESKFEVARLLMGFNTVRSDNPDAFSLEVLQNVLSGGKTSRLYRKLVEQEKLANSVACGDLAGRYPGWFSVQVELLQGKEDKASRQRAENLILAELKRLQSEPVGEAELQRVRRRMLASNVFDREDVHKLADTIAQGVTTNDLDYLKNYLPNLMKVSPADVQRVARKYFDPEQRVVVWSVPNAKAAGEAGGKGTPDKKPRQPRRAGEGGRGAVNLKDARRVVLPNGLTLLLYENRRLPNVVAEVLVRNVRLLEPQAKAGVAALTGALLDEGTARHSGPQIAELIEDVGGSLDLDLNGGTLKVLAPDRALGLGLLFECLTQPTFPEEEFAREKDRLLSRIDEAEQQPDTKAQQLYLEAAYGRHPYGRPALGRRKTVEALTRADCADFHRRLFVPNNVVVAVVGDFDSQQLIDEVTRLTAGWKKAPLEKPALPEVTRPGEFTQKIVTLKDAAQLHFYMGHAGIRRDNPDYLKLLVLDNILGTGAGFTDRLSALLRDRQGLAYTVSATITSSAAEEPGLFTCYIGTRPDRFELVKRLFVQEVARIRDEKVKPAEVEDAKKYLLGSLPFQFTTNDRIAAQLLNLERFHLGLDYYDRYRKEVAAVTAEDVREMARKYLDPKRMVLVAVGAIDPNGKPLDKPAPKP
jgi:zinc protease